MDVKQLLSFDGGINLFNEPHDLPENEAVQLQNLYPDSPGHLRTRPGTAVEFSIGTLAPLIDGRFLPFNGDAMMAVVSRSVANSLNTTIGAATTTGIITSADMGAVTPYGASLLNFRDKLYAFGGPGSNSSGKVLYGVSGTPTFTDFVFTTAGNTALRPTVAGVYASRIVFGNFGAGYESAFAFSDINEPVAVPANLLNSDYNDLASGDGDRITAFVEVALTGTPDIQNSLLVLKEYSGFLITGDPINSDGSGADTLQLMRLPFDCGCSSQNTVVRTPFGLLWAGPDDVWVMPEGQLPYRIGTKIRPALEASPANVRYRWHAAYSKGFYRLALFADGQGPTDDSTCTEQYWLDLRSGLPGRSEQAWREARWFGPMKYTNRSVFPEQGSMAMVVDTRPGANRALYYLTGHNENQDIVDFMSVDSPASLDAFRYDIRPADDSGIVQRVLTRDISTLANGNQLVSDPTQEKGFDGLEADLFCSRPFGADWYWNLNRGKEVGPTQRTLVNASGFLLGTSVLDGVSLSAEKQTLVLDPAPERAVGRSIQLSITTQGGYIVDDTNDRFNFRLEVTMGVFASVNVVVPQGFYTLSALASTLETAINSAISVTGITAAITTIGDKYNFARSGAQTWQIGNGFSFVDYAKTQILMGYFGFANYAAGYTGTNNWQAEDFAPEAPQPVIELDTVIGKFHTINRRSL